MGRRIFSLLFVISLLVACPSAQTDPLFPPGPGDASSRNDAGSSADANPRDSGRADGGVARDASHPPDADVPACDAAVIEQTHEPGDSCSASSPDYDCRVEGAFGVCERGILYCSNGQLSDCHPPAFVPEPAEYCGNCADDDCDGRTDENCASGCKNYEVCANGIDDDCDGVDDDGCELCQDTDNACYSWAIPPDEFASAGHGSGWGACIESMVCFLPDGTAAPARSCGSPHCGALRWPDGSVMRDHCTVIARCEGGRVVPTGFTW